MAGTVIEYLKKYGDIPFCEKPLNDVDSLALCQLSYLKFDGMVSDVRHNGPSVTLQEIAKRPDVEQLFGDVRFEKENRALFEGLLSGRRFRNMKLNCYINLVEKEWETQFSAITFILDDGTLFLAFRGTDETIVGWKEDFNMAFLNPVPGQEYSVKYVNMVTGWLHQPFYIGGHSKGGNLAVYSAMKCAPFVRKRIQKIYSLDGPGFRPEVLKECHYNAIEDKVVKLLPHSSMIGMIFERDIHYRVVESKNHGLLQHDPFSWLVKDDHFVDVGDIYESQKIMNVALNEWFLSLNEEQVRTFVDTLYQVISASQADDLITFTADWKKSMNAVVTALKEVDDQTAEMLRGIIRSLFEIARCKVKEELIATKKTRHRFKNTKRAGKAEEVRPDPAASPDATVTQGSAARHAPKLRGSHRQGRPG